MRGIASGLALGLAVVGIVLACSAPGRVPVVGPSGPSGIDFERYEKRNLINNLWVQIRDWRHEGGMDLEPPQSMANQYRSKSIKEVRRACPDNHPIPKTSTCEDTCTLADHICDNAETICTIADELGKQDPAQDKCTSAKASCREAKQRCCDCKPTPNGDTQQPGTP